MNIVSLFFESLSLWKKDKWVMLFSLFPVLIGGFLYFALGNFFIGEFSEMGMKFLETKIGFESWGTFVRYIVVGFFSIVFFFISSYTFVLVISLITVPFNDLISSRIEKLIFKEEMPSIGTSFNRMISQIGFTVINEIKKVIFIIFFTIIAFTLSLIPLLAPLGVFISALLMASNFLDYSWGRHNMKFKECFSSLKENLFINSLAGFGFMLLVSVPIVNLFVLPFGVIFFTNVFAKKVMNNYLKKVESN